MRIHASLIALVCLAVPASATLPEGWHGTWKGTLKMEGPKETSIPMELRVQPKEGGVYEFAITYGEGDKKQVRPYELRPVKDKPGRYVVDEKNGIELEGRLANGTLHFLFTAGDTLIETRYRPNGDSMIFELTSTDLKAGKATGPENLKVKSIPINAVQMAELKRAK